MRAGAAVGATLDPMDLRPLPWVVAADAFDLALRDQIEIPLQNMRRSRQPESYLAWAGEAERMLTNVLGPNDVRLLIHTPRHWVIVQAATTASFGALGAVMAEIEDRISLVQHVREGWKIRRHRWSGQVLSVVLDSSFVVESSIAFEKVNWVAACNAHNVRVVLPLIVLDELDDLKRAGRKSVQTASRTAVREVQQRVTGLELHGTLDWVGGVLDVFADEPDHVRLANNDWEIVDRAAYLQTLAEGPVRLATYDGGMRARALIRGVELVENLPPMRDE